MRGWEPNRSDTRLRLGNGGREIFSSIQALGRPIVGISCRVDFVSPAMRTQLKPFSVIHCHDTSLAAGVGRVGDRVEDETGGEDEINEEFQYRGSPMLEKGSSEWLKVGDILERAFKPPLETKIW